MTVLTFAIPFYAREPELLHHFLKFTINSVLAQTHRDWKLVVVDDKSPIEGVRQAVESYGDSRISYVLNEKNLGQAGNWNRCAEQVDTEFYTLLHADDALKPDYASKMLEALAANPQAAAVFCQADIIDERDRKISSFIDHVKSYIRPRAEFDLRGEDGLHMLLRGNFIMCPSVCYRKSLTRDIHFLEGERFKYIPDYYYWAQLMLNNRVMHSVPDNLFLYRRHGQSGTTFARSSTRTFAEEADFFTFIEAECRKLGWTRAAARAQRKRIVKLRTLYFLFHDLVCLRLGPAKDKAQFYARLR